MAKTTTARLEQQTGMRGFFVSAAVHLVLLAILFFVTISSPVAEEFKEALIIDFGDSPTGSGDDPDRFAGGSSEVTPVASSPAPSPAPPSTPVVATAPVKSKSTSNTIVTESPEAIALKKQQVAAEKAKKAAELKAAQEAAAKAAADKQYADSKAAMDNKWKKPGSGSGTGSGTSTGSGPGDGSGPGNGPGNMGNPNGVPGGLDWSMTGRTVLERPEVIDNSLEHGFVIVYVKLDNKGNVIYAKGPHKGSTINTPALVKKAEEAAYKWKFNAGSNFPEEQVGTIRINF